MNKGERFEDLSQKVYVTFAGVQAEYPHINYIRDCVYVPIWLDKPVGIAPPTMTAEQESVAFELVERRFVDNPTRTYFTFIRIK
jgi:hypothetical protein